MTRSLAFVTYGANPTLSEDDAIAARVLTERGWTVHAWPWDGECPEAPERLAGAVVRSTWNYHLEIDRFREWLEGPLAGRVALWNPPELIRWNSDKARYLVQLADEGVAIPPSHFLQRGTPGVSLSDLMRQHGWKGGAVLKPTSSASAYGTVRVPSLDHASHFEGHLSKLLRVGGVVVQAYLPEIQQGEWSLIYFNGGQLSERAQLSHAVLKRPASGDFRVQSELGGSTCSAIPPASLCESAEAILARIPYRWLYARVDGVIREGQFRLMELELIEPALFLSTAPHAGARFADAIESVLD